MGCKYASLSIATLHNLAGKILISHNVSAPNAKSVASALVAAEIDGLTGHGMARLPSYASQAWSGKVDGRACPVIEEVKGASTRIDAANGFAYPAIELACERLASICKQEGLAGISVYRSHHFGQAGYHAEQLARRGLVGLVFSNSPQAIAPWGGSRGLFGTNPIAFAAPRINSPPIVIDLSLSRVARGQIMLAAEKGQSIPEGWALDAKGRPTTDATAAMEGTLLPIGDAKGSALVMMVEILAACLTGAQLGFEASSFFTADGGPPAVGQFLLAIDPDFFSGGQFGERIETLVKAVEDDPGGYVPGSRKQEKREVALRDGILIDDVLYGKLKNLAE